MPSKSKKQHNLMAAVANNPKFAKKVGIPKKVGEDYIKADKGRKFQEGGKIMKNQMKIDAAKVAKMKANQEKKAALDAKKEAKKAQVDKKIGKKPGKPGGIFGRIKDITDKLVRQKPGKGNMMSKPVKQPVVKKPTKDSNPYKDFMDREKSLNRPKTSEKSAVESQKKVYEDAQKQPSSGSLTKLKKGGMACKKYARGGSVSSRADGCAKKGKTKGKFI